MSIESKHLKCTKKCNTILMPIVEQRLTKGV